jgi:hypothetical protein
MTLRIIDAEAELDAAFDQLEATLTAWAGGQADAWQRDGHDGVVAHGASFTRQEDVYIYLEAHRRRRVLGVALSERDKQVFQIEAQRQDPAKDKKRFVLAANDAQETFLLLAVEELKAQGIRDVFRRLAGAPAVKRANLSNRDYVLLGPLSDPKTAEALLSLAALHPAYEQLVEKAAGSAVTEADRAESADLYAMSPGVARQHRVQAKVTRALFERLTGLGYVMETVELGSLTADLAMSRGEDTVVFEIRPEADIDDLQKALGHLAIIAPRALGIDRLIMLPAPKDPIGAALDPYKQAFEEMGVSLALYDFRDGELNFVLEYTDPGLAADVRLALA